MANNVLGTELESCCFDPLTGYYRDGFCHTGAGDFGLHTICVVLTEDFLRFSYERGNDLVTPRPDMQFPGLVPGNRWCVCVERWMEALEAGQAPPIVLAATHSSVAEFVSMEDLRAHAVEPD